MKEYGHLLRNDPAYADRAQRFAAKCKDVTELLAELPPRAKRHPLQACVAFHDSCHLQNAQGIRTQPRQLLSQIPGLTLLEIPESPICCGSAGVYNLVQPEAATELGNRKAALISALSPTPDVVADRQPRLPAPTPILLSENSPPHPGPPHHPTPRRLPPQRPPKLPPLILTFSMAQPLLRSWVT